MKRRTLDQIFSVGGLLLAGLLLVVGLVLNNQASFANTYVTDQLTAQNITFTPADKLKDEEKQQACLLTYAGQKLTTGAQAECYANSYIGLHLKDINEGKTYSQTSTESRAKATQAAEAMKAKPDDQASKDLDKEAKALAGKVDTLFKGETLRGLLLTSYGFSIFGERAQQTAMVLFAAAAVLLLATIAGFVHAFGKHGGDVVK